MKKAAVSVSALLALGVVWIACTVSAVLVLPPQRGTVDSPALILIGDPCVASPSAYRQLALAIQEATEMELWIAVAAPVRTIDAAFASAAAKVASNTLDVAFVELNNSGFTGKDVIVSGHGLSGASLVEVYYGENLNQDAPLFDAACLILIGSFIPRKYHGRQPPLPTLTLSGELDQFARITRLMEAHWYQTVHRDLQTVAPVVVIPGMNHFQLVDRTLVSQTAIELDLAPEIDDHAAMTNVSAAIASFFDTQTRNSVSGLLGDLIRQTSAILEPLLRAFSLEGYYYFIPPCMSLSEQTDCTIGSQWVARGQVILADVPSVDLTVNSTFFPTWSIYPDPLPVVQGKCSPHDERCSLHVDTYADARYEDNSQRDGVLDDGKSFSSAREISAKFRSRQTILLAAGMDGSDFEKSDGGSLCAAVNKAAIDWAVNNASPESRSRYMQYGKPLVTGDDIDTHQFFPLFLVSYLDFSQSPDSKSVIVRAPTLRSPAKQILSFAEGFHFCKCLTPARAMEYLYIDSIRGAQRAAASS